jgi:type IV pilus assembly protein PilM
VGRIKGDRLRFDIFTPKAPPLFGLDIGNSAVKMVELSVVGKGTFRLERYVIEPLPKEVVFDGNINNVEEVSAAIKRALQKFGSPLKSVALGLPSASLITKRVSMSSDLAEDDMEKQVSSEAEQYIPFNINEVNLDFQIMGSSSKVPGEADVLIAAARKEKIDERVASADLSNLRVLVVDAEALATAEAVRLVAPPEKYPNQNVAYAQVETDTVGITVYRNGEIIFTRDQAFGGMHLTSEIMHQYDVTAEVAEQIRTEVARQPENYREVILDPFYDMISQEIQRAMQMFITSTPYAQADLLVLGGPLAAEEGLLEKIVAQIGFSTVVANPFVGMKYGSGVRESALLKDASSLMTACGLALRRFDEPTTHSFVDLPVVVDGASQAQSIFASKFMINVLPHRELRRAALRKQFTFMGGSVAALGLAVGLLVHGVISGYAAVQESRNNFIVAENVKLDAQIEEIKRINDDIEALLARKQVIESLQSDRAQAIQILDQMVRIAPSGLYLTTMKQNGLKVAISGYAPSSDQVSAFMVSVQNSPYLEKPELVEIKASTVGQRRLAEFSMNFSLKRPKAEDTNPKNQQGKVQPLKPSSASHPINGASPAVGASSSPPVPAAQAGAVVVPAPGAQVAVKNEVAQEVRK